MEKDINAKNPKKQTTSLISYPSVKEKEYFTNIAREHGLSLSAFYRLAAEEYIHEHNWETMKEGA